MAKEIYYECGKDGTQLDLHDADLAFVLMGSGIHSRSWNRTIAARGASGISKTAREIKMSYVAVDEHANRLRNAFDADIRKESPGTLVYQGWSTRCYVFDGSTAEQYAGWVKREATVLLIDAFWWLEKSKHFVTGLDAGGIDHPYDYPHDLSFSSGKGELNVGSALGALPRITFYGPCTNPYVVIGGNRYEVDVSVNSGYTVVIDALGSQPTVERIDNQGNVENVFAYAVRTGGEDGGSYAFQPLPYGKSTVEWSGAFAFDVTWRELDTEPPWNR